jgi:hypothetical protein
MLLEKRTTSNSSLLGSGGAYTAAPTGGTAYALADNTTYTLQLSFNEVSAGDMAVTTTLLQGSTTLSTLTTDDTGTAFGGAAIASGLLTGSQSIYTNFDQFFFRNSDATQATTLDFTNYSVNLSATVPEPASLAMFAIAGGWIAARRRRA